MELSHLLSDALIIQVPNHHGEHDKRQNNGIPSTHCPESVSPLSYPPPDVNSLFLAMMATRKGLGKLPDEIICQIAEVLRFFSAKCNGWLTGQSLGKSDLLRFRIVSHRTNRCCTTFVHRRISRELTVTTSPPYLHHATQRCLHQTIQAIISLGVPIDIKNLVAETALHTAARANCLKAIQLLCRAGADVNARSLHEWTPLLLAARYGNREITKELLAFGAIVNLKGFHGWTALHLAYQYGHSEIMNLLLLAGADKNIQDNDKIMAQQAFKTQCWGSRWCGRNQTL